MTELNILKVILIIYWIISTSYFYKRGEEINKKYNLTSIVNKIIIFLLAIFIGWYVFPFHLGRFLGVEILKSEYKHKEME